MDYMKSLLFFILLSCCSIVVQAEPSKTVTVKHSNNQASKHADSKVKSKIKEKEKKFVKSILTPAQPKKQDKKSKKIIISKKKVIEIDQLKEIIDSFPEKDRKIITTIRKQITTWPKEVFDEISDYREFIISARKVAQQKYDLLSPEAKSALETERHLKSKLSTNTVRTLESLEVDID